MKYSEARKGRKEWPTLLGLFEDSKDSVVGGSLGIWA